MTAEETKQASHGAGALTCIEACSACETEVAQLSEEDDGDSDRRISREKDGPEHPRDHDAEQKRERNRRASPDRHDAEFSAQGFCPRAVGLINRFRSLLMRNAHVRSWRGRSEGRYAKATSASIAATNPSTPPTTAVSQTRGATGTSDVVAGSAT